LTYTSARVTTPTGLPGVNAGKKLSSESYRVSGTNLDGAKIHNSQIDKSERSRRTKSISLQV
jgi:hypothetical protein